MITIYNREWFDKQNGNTYFSSEVFLGMDLIMKLPMQYGYGKYCIHVLNEALRKHFGIDQESSVYETMVKNGIKISVSTKDVKKRDLNKSEAFQDFSAFLKPENLALYAAHRMREGIALNHHTMENCFIQCLYSDFANIGEGLGIPFTEFNWF